ncbi:MAG: molybdate ABC transporter substrate-binding protein [Sphingomonas sp.]|uniref:molybdate ABC transporter substrate-binding protein n=1 Tax=Sphingomonas sp. TaxID=28214 RepID=UPI0025DAF84A|nr:molybdate ABC transporter substrate-binding protein [Sphingomonas sp.]MBX9883058.1 molybdate ABC transporter substrate-binding protein [Sphingomonas sp.]
MLRLILGLLAWLALAAPVVAAPADDPPLVLAAASLQEVLNDAADRWAAAGHARPVLSFAASSALARQAASGARADLFVSADSDWMDWLARRGAIEPESRATLAGNMLVLIAPRANRDRLAIGQTGALAALVGGGPLAIADPSGVPAGRYAQQALESLGAWRAVERGVVRAENVRAALALVERGAARFGIVYATDARASRAVRVLATFPPGSHAPIFYPVARLKGARASAEGFRRYLLSAEGRALFRARGFSL